MKRYRPYLIGAAIGGLALLMLPLVGLLDHRATAGWRLFGWYDWLSTRQSVTLHSLTTLAPDLSDPARARRAAGHYQLVCAACHASPVAPAERMAKDLSPEPPHLANAERWRPAARVFQTVKYGIHKSAMPGWPAQQRDDEVWDMVAFLERLPDLSPEAYQSLAGSGSCQDCHGAQGEGRDGIPRLNIQTPEYLADALRAFRSGTRASGTMIAAARRLSDADIDELAAQFGRAVPLAPRSDTPSEPAAALALKGQPERDIPACLSCHSGDRRADYPRLVGQDRDYLKRQLTLFRDLGTERGGRHAAVMAPIAKALPEEAIDSLVDWLSQP